MTINGQSGAKSGDHTQRGFHVPHTRDMTGVGASYAPRSAMLTRPSTALQPAPAASQRPVPKPCAHNPPAGGGMTRCQRRFTQFTRPVFPLPVAPRWNGSSWAFRRASDPSVTSDARRGGDRPLSTSPELRLSTSVDPPILEFTRNVRPHVAPVVPTVPVAEGRPGRGRPVADNHQERPDPSPASARPLHAT